MHTFCRHGICRGMFLVWVIIALLTAVGCGRKNVPSDGPVARQSLTTALESWKAGDPPSKIRGLSPSITMVEPAWEAGRKLEAYEVVGPEVDEGINLICPVKLVCKDQQGNTLTAQIKYMVGTTPAITIFRHRSSY